MYDFCGDTVKMALHKTHPHTKHLYPPQPSPYAKSELPAIGDMFSKGKQIRTAAATWLK
jgi:hypothetical protein